MKLTRRTIFASLMAILASGVAPGAALAGPSEIFAPGGVAISGYDPVAYFTEGRPVAGTAAHALKWRGATWYFASAQAREAFEMNPGAYAPQYGGYCALSMSMGAISPTVPEAFLVHEGRLFLYSSTSARAIWSVASSANVSRANGYWPAALTN